MLLLLLLFAVIGLVAVACVYCLSVLASLAPILHGKWTDEDAQPGNPPLLVVVSHGWYDIFWLNLENSSDKLGLVVQRYIRMAFTQRRISCRCCLRFLLLEKLHDRMIQVVSWNRVIWSKRICVVDGPRCLPEFWSPGLGVIVFIPLANGMYTRQEAQVWSIDMDMPWIRIVRASVVFALDCLDCLLSVVGVESSLIPATHVDYSNISVSRRGIFIQQV